MSDPAIAFAETHRIEMLKGIIERCKEAGEDTAAQEAELERLNNAREHSQKESIG